MFVCAVIRCLCVRCHLLCDVVCVVCVRGCVCVCFCYVCALIVIYCVVVYGVGVRVRLRVHACVYCV